MKRFVLIGVAVLALAACGGGGGGGNSDAAQDGAQITKVWQDFFSSKVDVSKKPAMVENWAPLKSQIDAVFHNPYGLRFSARVPKVTVDPNGKTAAVVYSIYMTPSNYPKDPYMKNVPCTALKQNGHWVIAFVSVCKLLGSGYLNFKPLPPTGFKPPPACRRFVP